MHCILLGINYFAAMVIKADSLIPVLMHYCDNGSGLRIQVVKVNTLNCAC